MFCSTAFNIYRPLWPFAGHRERLPRIPRLLRSRTRSSELHRFERLWLLKAFLKLAPQAAIEIIELIERLASAPPASDHPSSRQVLRLITRAEALIEVKVLCLTFTLVDERKERSRPTKFGASFPGRWEEFIVGPHPFG